MLALLNLQKENSFSLQILSLLEYVINAKFITYVYALKEKYLYNVEKQCYSGIYLCMLGISTIY